MRTTVLQLVTVGPVLALTLSACAGPDDAWSPPPTGVAWDYQLGGDYDPSPDVGVVVRDWSDGAPLEGAYSVCYVNAFQTQPDDPDTSGDRRPDETSSWPADLVLRDLGSDPGWPGEYLVDLGSGASRARAAEWVTPLLQHCAAAGFDAVELDNLDSWTRFSDAPTADGEPVPFGQDDAVAYAALLTATAHDLGLAVARKNTPQLDRETSLDTVGFDFAVVEECGTYGECDAYTDVFGDGVLAVEYTDDGFAAACAAIGDRASVVRRDVDLTTPESADHVDETC